MLLACCILHITPRFHRPPAVLGILRNTFLRQNIPSCVLHFFQCEQVCCFPLLDGDVAATAVEARWDDANRESWALVCKSL
jgi:hypothetical protein